MKRLALPLVLVGLTVFAYANTFDGEWHLDDYTYIIEDGSTGDVAARARGLLSDNRGLGRLTFTLNYLAGGFSPPGYHVVNLLIHLANAFLVFLLTRAVLVAPRLDTRASDGERETLAWGVALLFAVHPLQTEAVTYVVQRWTALAATFYLGALLAMISYLRSGRRSAYAAALACALLALRTKELAVTLPLAFFAMGWAFYRPEEGGPRRRRLATLLPMLLLVAVVPVTNYLFPHYNAVSGNRVADALRETTLISPFEYLLTQFGVVPAYLRLALWPAGLNLDHDVRLVRSLVDPAAFVPLALLAALAAAAVLARRSAPLVLFGTGFFVLTIAPESSLLPITDLMFEHRMYLPLVGLLLAVVGLLRALPRVAPRVPALLVLLAIPLALVARQRNEVWRTETALWTDAASKSPRKARPHQSLGLAHARAGRLAEAERELRVAIACDSSFADPYVNLAGVLERQGRRAEVEPLYRDAIARCRRHYMIHNNLGLLLADRGDVAAAQAEYREAIAENDRYALPHLNLGNLLVRLGRGDEAERSFAEALERDPYLLSARVNLGALYAARGEVERARNEWRTVLRQNPRHASALENLERARLLGDAPPPP